MPRIPPLARPYREVSAIKVKVAVRIPLVICMPITTQQSYFLSQVSSSSDSSLSSLRTCVALKPLSVVKTTLLIRPARWGCGGLQMALEQSRAAPY